MKIKFAIRSILFILIFCALLAGVSFFMQPVWKDWNNYDTINGFYEEPENTFETVYLGASMMINGIDPMQIYAKYGVCSYNLATEKQPVMTSYYWMKEAYRLHEKTLKTVILDVSMIRGDAEDAFYHKALDGMEFSSVKYDAVKDITTTLEERIQYLIPAFAYHDRWASLSKQDFVKIGYEANAYMLGYNLEFSRIFSGGSFNRSQIFYPINTDIESPDASQVELDEKALYYLKQMMDFCSENGLQLVFVKTPSNGNWTRAEHDVFQRLAERYSIEFYDFDTLEYFNELGFISVLDCKDRKHMNYYGAQKFSDWMGNFLITKCGNTDVRGLPQYSFMDEQYAEYLENVPTQVTLMEATDVCDYLEEAMKLKDCTVMITVRGDAAAELTAEQKTRLGQMGLSKLSRMDEQASYIAVIEDGQVTFEKIDLESAHPELVAAEEEEAAEEAVEEYDLEAITLDNDNGEEDGSDETPIYLEYNSILRSGAEIMLRSGSEYLGNLAHIWIDGKNYSVGSWGFNIVIYDNNEKDVLNTTAFNTHISATRDTRDLETMLKETIAAGIPEEEWSQNLLDLKEYLERQEFWQFSEDLKASVGEMGLISYLEAVKDKENLTVIIAVRNDGAGKLDDEVRAAFTAMGLPVLGELEYANGYLCVIDGGNLVVETQGGGETPLTYDYDIFHVESAGRDAGHYCSILIDGVEYAKNNTGINVVVYDKDKELLFDTLNFNTSKQKVTLP